MVDYIIAMLLCYLIAKHDGPFWYIPMAVWTVAAAAEIHKVVFS